MNENIYNYFTVTVKLDQDAGVNKDGSPKTKTESETYLVRESTAEKAAALIKGKFSDYSTDWKIVQVKESNIIDVF